MNEWMDEWMDGWMDGWMNVVAAETQQRLNFLIKSWMEVDEN